MPQALDDAGAALAPGREGAPQLGQVPSQVGFGVGHHHPRQAGLEHRQVVEAVAGGDHQAVVEGLGCKALRVTDPAKLQSTLREAQTLAHTLRTPVVVEVILEKVTNIAMGTEINAITEFDEVVLDEPAGAE